LDQDEFLDPLPILIRPHALQLQDAILPATIVQYLPLSVLHQNQQQVTNVQSLPSLHEGTEEVEKDHLLICSKSFQITTVTKNHYSKYVENHTAEGSILDDKMLKENCTKANLNLR
jgi:hypothetical protein